MAAASDPSGELALPHTWRPLGPRIASAIAGGTLFAIVAMLWISFDDETRASVTPFQRGTVLFLLGLMFAVLFALVRSKVQAHPDRLVVVNGFRRHEYDWAEVVAVRLGTGAPWVSLDLADGTSAPAIGIQASDGLRAKRAVAQLRLLLDSAHAPGD
jgi:hypothetical protein